MFLGDVCDFENGDRGINYPSKAHYVTTGVPFVSAGQLSAGHVEPQRLNYIPLDRFELLRSGKFIPGDLLFCLRGSLGKFGRVGADIGRGAIASSLVIVRPKATAIRKVSPDFLAYYFESELCARMIERFAGGAAQPNLGAKDLAKFLIPVPPLYEQRCIVAKLDEESAQSTLLRSNILDRKKRSSELQSSILAAAFAGAL